MLKFTVQVVVLALPMVIWPDWFVLPATTAPLVVAPQPPDEMVGRPSPVKISWVWGLSVVNVPAAGAVLPPIARAGWQSRP